MLWHMRMGHPSFKVLRQLFSVNKDADMLVHNSCSVCPLAKQTRIPFPTSVSRASSPFDLIHLDAWGPYRYPTHNRFRFFLTIVDDNSRMVWLFLLKFKSDVFGILKSFFALVENQFSRQIKKSKIR